MAYGTYVARGGIAKVCVSMAHAVSDETEIKRVLIDSTIMHAHQHDLVQGCRARKVTPHAARNDAHRGGSAIDGRTSRHAGYGISQVIRKHIEEHFGWGKTVGRIRQTAYRGIKRVDQHFKLTMLVSNLIRMARILAAVSQGAAR